MEYEYVCIYCDKSYRTLQKLNYHLVCLHKVRPYGIPPAQSPNQPIAHSLVNQDEVILLSSDNESPEKPTKGQAGDYDDHDDSEDDKEEGAPPKKMQKQMNSVQKKQNNVENNKTPSKNLEKSPEKKVLNSAEKASCELATDHKCQYREGYQACQKEAMKFLINVKGPWYGIDLVNHLQEHFDKLSGEKSAQKEEKKISSAETTKSHNPYVSRSVQKKK